VLLQREMETFADWCAEEESGTYTLEPVDTEITVSEYPIECALLLQDPDSVADFLVGPTFTVQSTGGVASIYSPSTTRALSDAPTTTDSGSRTTAASSSSGGTGKDSSASNTANAADSADSTETGVDPASATSTSSASSSAGGLSSGAKAGIAIGVLLAVALVVLALFYALRTRRRLEAMESELQETKKQHESDRAYVDGILKAAGKPDTKNGGRVVMAEAPNRGSGEWKKFFNAKGTGSAACGSQAGSGVGGNGGSFRPSRLGTSQGVNSPSPGPGPPSPSVDGSQVGLVGR
jgi:hypothetical protein